MNRNTVLVILLGLGIVISGYLTYVHYSPSALVCLQSGIINCKSVVTSSYSVIFGVPLAVYSLLWFALALILTHYKKTRTIAEIWLLIGIGGIIYSLFSMYMLGEICVYCISLDVLIALSIALFFKEKPK
jgi:uncharacterized membrane protein